jgi:diguanylate cyclase (GGDEF)-like protein
VGSAIAASLDPEEISSAVVHYTEKLLKPKAVVLYRYHPSTQQLSIDAIHGAATGLRLGRSFPAGEGIVGLSIREKRTVALQDPRTESSYSPQCDIPWFAVEGDWICLPLQYGEEVLGAVEIIVPRGWGEWGGENGGTLLKTIADFSAVALRNADAMARLRELAIIDHVTGLHNGRYLQEILSHEISRARRYRSTFTLIFMDLDYFKRVNDEFGHLVGSQLLRSVGQWVQKQLRESDICVRWGGDEFILFLPNTSKEGGTIVARRLCMRMPAESFLEQKLVVSASFGVVAFPDDGGETEDLIKKADEAMYRVKNHGRNGVETY